MAWWMWLIVFYFGFGLLTTIIWLFRVSFSRLPIRFLDVVILSVVMVAIWYPLLLSGVIKGVTVLEKQHIFPRDDDEGGDS